MFRFFSRKNNGTKGIMTSNANDNMSSNWNYPNKPGFHPRPLRIAICGAGAAGLCLAYKILEAQKKGVLGPVEFVLFEKDDDYTGTWHANRYPGCRCDNPSASYQYSFAPYADWPEYYSSAAEIKRYFKIFAQKFGIVPFIRLRHKVTAAIYDQTLGMWDITVENLETSQVDTKSYDIFSPATGVLSTVHRPVIPGLESFTKAPVLHTAEWPVGFDWQSTFKDERVAVIGIGSSGLQTIGAIAPYCKNLDIYAKSKFWVVPVLFGPQGRDWHNENFSYSEEEQANFIKTPETLHRHLKEVSAPINGYYDIVRKGSEAQKVFFLINLALGDLIGVQTMKQASIDHMKSSIGSNDVFQTLVPDFAVGCRRPTPGGAFLEALKLSTVELTYKPIKMVTPNSIITDDSTERSVDRIILATGFETGLKPSYKFLGKDGVDLRDVWAQRPKAYMSMAVAGFPNMFLMGCGPGITYANGALLPCTEAQADFVVACLSKLQKQDIKTMEVNKDAQDEYNIQQEAVMKDLVFTEPCSSWYKGGKVDGEPDAIYAGSTLQFMEMLASPRWEDWTFVPLHRNRFSYLGNGTSTVEATGGDRAYYFTIEGARNALKASDYQGD
ncbi:related to monooxigenase [Armillaria ostoyae]|uniref:Related to monooxigenase n=1 Tax=Armillaria ostoyae TaxID=47428 RepID=A0A284RIT9_ARMOS|nr:related to monooxigenase [Armillaria ostoyae]